MKKTIKKRAFISAIAMLIVSAIVLTSSTFAWFSMAKQAAVDMDLTIASPDGIQISANTTAFTTALTMDDFKGESGSRYVAYDGNENHFPMEISPVSSNLYIAATKTLPKFFATSINEDGTWQIINIEKETDTAAAFVVFDVFVQLAETRDITIENTAMTCEDNPEVLTAMRIATVNCGVVSKGADATTIKNTKPVAQNVNSKNVIQMIEPDPNNHTQAAIEKGASNGTPVKTYAIREAIKSGGTHDSKYYNIYGHGNGQTSEPYASTDYIIKGQQGVNRIRVYVWMEGQDVDCANDVAGAALSLKLQFNLLDK